MAGQPMENALSERSEPKGSLRSRPASWRFSSASFG